VGWQTIDAVILHAGNTIINPSGQFIYTPSPGAGNLWASITTAATSADDFGNATVAGVAQYAQIGGTWFAVALEGALVTWFSAASQAGPYTAIGDLEATTLSGGTLLINFAAIAGTINVPAAAPSIATLPTDNNSGSTWVSGERAFMNNNWVANINNNFSNIVSALAAAGIIV
jgi:hypothetical protein